MQPHTPPCWHPLVHALLVHRVEEAIPRRHRPVRPFHCSPRLQKLLPAGQCGTSFLDVDLLHVDASGHCRRRELHPGHARRFQHPPVCGADLPELLLDQVPQALRQLHGHGFEPSGTVQPTASSCTTPCRTMASTALTMNNGLPPVRRWRSQASPSGSDRPAYRAARYAATPASVRYARGSSAHCPCRWSSCMTVRKGCARTSTSIGR